MDNKYRIIETEHADGSFSYVAEVGKCIFTGHRHFPNIEYVWEVISITPKPLLDLAKQDIESYKANLPTKNKVVYEE